MVNFNATLIAQVLNFLILVFILAKFAYKPLMKIMDDRKNKIAGDLAAAETAKTDAESIKAEYAAKLAAARQEAQAIIDNARKTAQTAHDKILADTKAEQDQIVKTAKEAIALEKKQALSEIRAHVINLSLVAASKIVEQKLGSEEDKKLAGDIVDAVIFLDKNKILPIDSKFSLENYNRMIAAKNKEEKDRLLTKVKNDLKMRIDETSKYILPNENTMDFAFMFIPSESLYYDLLVSNVGTGSSSRDLIEYAFRDKKVIVVSPTSFMAYLQTVLQGLRSLQIEEQAKDIQKRVGQLSSHLQKFDEYMGKLGRSLETTVNQYNNAHKELGKVDKDMIKISDTEPAIKQIEIEKPKQDL